MPLVQFSAGFRLLDKFKVQWEELHHVSESNVQKTHSVMSKLDAVGKNCSNQLEAFDIFTQGFKSLSSLEEQINNIHNDLEVLEGTFMKIEECLSTLMRDKVEREAEQFARDCEGNCEASMQREKIHFEIRKNQLMSDHLIRVQDYESDQQKKLAERRLLLKKEFEEEKNRYIRR